MRTRLVSDLNHGVDRVPVDVRSLHLNRGSCLREYDIEAVYGRPIACDRRAADAYLDRLGRRVGRWHRKRLKPHIERPVHQRQAVGPLTVGLAAGYEVERTGVVQEHKGVGNGALILEQHVSGQVDRRL